MTTSQQNGLCPPPFLQESFFPSTGGYVSGRFCNDVGSLNGTVSCCLPCPFAEWRYTDNLPMKTTVSSWLAVGLLPLSAFILITYAALPIKFSHRHYLTICFTIAITFLQIAFVIPLGTSPSQCHNAITPNDMTTNLSCAFTGFLLLYGGMAVVTWCLLRTVALHLQVCWEIVIGQKFMWMALICGWGFPAIVMVLMFIYTGVSYRFGEVCHINGPNSTGDYWIPLLVIIGIAMALQAITLGYCINVYVRSLFDASAGSTSTSGLPSSVPTYSGSVRTVTARQAYKRIRRVLQLQWRSIAVVLTIIVNAIYFCVVLLELNRTTSLTTENLDAAAPWLVCLTLNYDAPQKCTSEASAVGPNEATILAVLFMLPLSGLWNFIFSLRSSMLTGWLEYAKGLFVKHNEFVSADARERFQNLHSYDMISAPSSKMLDPTAESARSPSPVENPRSFVHWGGTKLDDIETYGRDAQYSSPTLSFSSPRPPSASHNNPPRYWDASSTFAPSMNDNSRQKPGPR